MRPALPLPNRVIRDGLPTFPLPEFPPRSLVVRRLKSPTQAKTLILRYPRTGKPFRLTRSREEIKRDALPTL